MFRFETPRSGTPVQVPYLCCMKIICGVDFSEPSRTAAQIAARLARRWNDTLVLAHVMDVSGYAMLPEIASFATSFADSSRDVLATELQGWSKRLLDTGARVETELLSGSADVSLVNLAQAQSTRLMVAGTHGAQGMRRWLLGSVAERLAQHAPYPVLVVGPEARGLAQWAQEERPMRALVAIDDSEASDAAIHWVRGLRAVQAVDVTFVHFYFPPDEHRRLGLTPRMPITDDRDVMRALYRDLHQRIGSLPGEGHMHLRVHANWISVAERLTAEAEQTRADVLVLGAHQRGLLGRMSEGSVVQQTLRSSQVPILTVPLQQARAANRRLMPEMRIVMACTDLSELGNHAVPYAYAMLRSGGGLVHLVHVCEDATQQAAAEAQMRSLVPQDAEMYGITTSVQVVIDRPVAQGIAHAAERLGVDAICMGSHGRGGLARAVLGSVVTELSSISRKPVLLVRGPRP